MDGIRLDGQKLKASEEIPEWLSPLIGEIESLAGLTDEPIRQVLCTEYEAGLGIGWHRDKPHFDKIVGLSLGSACKFRFRRKAGNAWERFTLACEPRSLYVMTGASRQIWQHSIPPVETERHSITFRTKAGENAKILAQKMVPPDPSRPAFIFNLSVTDPTPYPTLHPSGNLCLTAA